MRGPRTRGGGGEVRLESGPGLGKWSQGCKEGITDKRGKRKSQLPLTSPPSALYQEY